MGRLLDAAPQGHMLSAGLAADGPKEAARRLRYTVKRTMAVAQQLYEGVEIDGEARGLITYMRPDSVRQFYGSWEHYLADGTASLNCRVCGYRHENTQAA